MTTHSIILTWRIKWMEEPGRLQSTDLQRVGRDWATNTFINAVCIIFLHYSWWIHYHFSSIMLYLYVFLTSPFKSLSNALKFSKYSSFTILFKVISWHFLLRAFLRDIKHNADLNIKVRWTRKVLLYLLFHIKTINFLVCVLGYWKWESFMTI